MFRKNILIITILSMLPVFSLTLPANCFASDKHEASELKEKHNENTDHDIHEGENIVNLTNEEMQEFGIVTSIAGPGTLRIQFTLPGEVVVNYDKLAHIAPRFPGVVKKVFKHLGDDVKKGDVLAIIESNEGLVPYEVKSLLDGTVIEKHITIGEVRSEDTPAFVIADLSDVWVNLSVYQMHLPYVKVGQEVIIIAGQEFPEAVGTISYISPIVDEHTRTATARVVLDNRLRQWRPGLFIEGIIAVKNEEVSILVSKSSLQKMENQDVIFVKVENGYEPIPVKIGRTDHDSAEILYGLNIGQQYVSKGGFTLKAELQKGSLSEGHSH